MWHVAYIVVDYLIVVDCTIEYSVACCIFLVGYIIMVECIIGLIASFRLISQLGHIGYLGPIALGHIALLLLNS